MQYYEWLLSLFAFLNFSVSGLWLAYLYYACDTPLLVDNFGVISALLALIIPINILIEIQQKNKQRRLFWRIFSVIVFILLSSGHYLLSSSPEFYLFHPKNSNFKLNIGYQLSIDFILLFILLVLYSKKNKSNELFDGTFKKFFGIVFISYFGQDILILLMMYFSEFEITYHDILRQVSLVLTLLLSIFLGLMGIATNYLQLWHALIAHQHTELIIVKAPISTHLVLDLNDVKKSQPVEWNKLKLTLNNQFGELITEIDQNNDLTKTEKLYAFLSHFNLSHKEIADLLSVSIRTVETNFYRLRLKENKANKRT